MKYKYEIGDLVICTDTTKDNFEKLITNKLYEVVGREVIDGDILYAVKDSNENIRYSIDRFEKFKYKIGDKIVVLRDTVFHMQPIGSIRTIKAINFNNCGLEVEEFYTALFIDDVELLSEYKEKLLKDKTKPTDIINQPYHYTSGGIEVIDYIKAKLTKEEYKGYIKGNILKYISRAGKKESEISDISKASWYAHRLEKEIKGDDK